MQLIRTLAIFWMMVLVFALPTDGAVEVAGMSLVKIAGLLSFGLAAVLIAMGSSMHAMAGFHTLVLLYVAWVVFSFTWSEMPVPYETSQAVSSDQAIKSNIYALMIALLIFQLAHTTTQQNWLYVAFVLGSFWLVYLMVKDYQVSANTVRHEIKQFDANEVSVKLAMVMPLAIYLLTRTKVLWWRVLGGLYIPAAMFTIMITGSRTGALVMVMGLMGFIPTILRSGVMGKAASVILVIATLIGIASVIPQKTVERIFSTGKEISSGTLNERSVIWAKAYEEWEEKPFVGHGLGSFRRIINPYNVDYTAHNSFVAITVEQGIIGSLLYFAVIVAAGFAALQLSGDERWLMLLVLGIVTLGQMSLTLQDRMYVWFTYALIALNTYNSLRNARMDYATQS